MWLSFLDEMDVFLIIGELLNPWMDFPASWTEFCFDNIEMSIDIIDIDNQLITG